MLMEGIQSAKLCKIRSNSGDKATSGVDAETKLEMVYKMKYKINLDHQILIFVFYPQVLDKDLIFELTLAPASQVVMGTDASKLVYKLKNIQLEYERIRSKQLADKATTAYTHGKMYAYDQIQLEKTVTFDRGTAADLNLLVNPQRRSLKGILLLFIEPYVAGARDSEKYFNPDITNVEVTINCIPNRVYNNGIKGHDMWRGASRLFSTKGNKQGAPNVTLAKYLSGNKFSFFLDLRSMAGRQNARQWPTPCQLRKRCANRSYKNHLRLRNCEMPHFRHQ